MCNIQDSIDCFLSGNVGVFGNYIATKNALVFRRIAKPTPNGLYEIRQSICAIKVNGNKYIGNSSILTAITNHGQSEIQQKLSIKIPMLPFNSFFEAKLDLAKTKVIEQGQEETVKVKIQKWNDKTGKYDDVFEPRHFIGASLFEIDGKQFLFDIDRQEIENGIFNPFIVELATNLTSIKAAYESLKPNEVLEAEKQGLKVKRQGEWFFIPVDKIFQPMKKENGLNIEGLLQAGNNRPNYAEKFYGKVLESKNRWDRQEISVEYVSGKISHSGREHQDLILKGWYKPVPNTSVKSFTLTGNVD